jgi:hypothetical protein
VAEGGDRVGVLRLKGGYGEIVKMLEEKGAKNRNGDVLKKGS